MVELNIDDYSERLPLALSIHALFLGHDWLKIHNPAIDWKKGAIQLICAKNHISNLLPIDSV